MVERGGLENRYPDFRDRRFESSSLRQLVNGAEGLPPCSNLLQAKKGSESFFRATNKELHVSDGREMLSAPGPKRTSGRGIG